MSYIISVRNIVWIWSLANNFTCGQGRPCDLQLNQFRAVEYNCPSNVPICGDCQVCLPGQLQIAAINLTLEIQSYILNHDPVALYSLADPLTPVNSYVNYPYLVENLEEYANMPDDLNRVYIDTVMEAVIDENTGTISVSVTELIFDGSIPMREYLTTFFWTQDRTQGKRNSCYLKLLRIDVNEN
jgi:hypothetical protein